MTGRGSKKRSKSGTSRRKKKSKYSGKVLDTEFRETLGGLGAKIQSKDDDALFFTDKNSGPAPSRRTLIRKAYLEKRRRRAEVGKVIPKTSLFEKKKVEKIQKAAKAEAAKANTNTAKEDVYDIWGTETPLKKQKREANPWVQPVLPDEKKITHQAKSKFEPVRVCHPGGSYNPSSTDHNKGLEELVKKEQIRRSKIHSKVTSLFQRFENAGQESDLEEEQKEEEEEEEQKEEEQKEQDKTIYRQKPKEKLTRAQRNKKRRLEIERREQEQVKKAKQLKAELSNISEIAKKVRKIEAKQKEVQLQKKKLLKEKEENAEPIIRVNGKEVPQATPIEVVLPSQMSDNLRRMIPHGGIVSDRFKSMQSRNLIDTGVMTRQRRKPRGRKKAITQGKPFFEKKLVNTPKGTKSTPKKSKQKSEE